MDKLFGQALSFTLAQIDVWEKSQSKQNSLFHFCIIYNFSRKLERCFLKSCLFSHEELSSDFLLEYFAAFTITAAESSFLGFGKNLC